MMIWPWKAEGGVGRSCGIRPGSTCGKTEAAAQTPKGSKQDGMGGPCQGLDCSPKEFEELREACNCRRGSALRVQGCSMDSANSATTFPH